MRIVAKNWENISNKIKELENRIIAAKIWSIIISSLSRSVGYVSAGDLYIVKDFVASFERRRKVARESGNKAIVTLQVWNGVCWQK